MSLTLNNFLNQEYIYYANYDNFLSLANYIDGFKPTQRKVFYTYYSYIKKGRIKVSQLASKMAELTQYISGEVSAQGVIVNLAKDFSCSGNNISYFEPEGFFGDRFAPNSASAPRYIYVKENPIMKYIFREEDLPLLQKQFFEGYEIEYKFYVPIIPMILINEKRGIGNGFAQLILARNPKEIIEYIENYLKTGKLPTEIKPFYKGFSGKFYKDENKWVCLGNIKDIKNSTIIINEIPINYDLNSYIKVLEKLKEQKKILSYVDKSEDNKFYFEVKIKNAKNYSIDELYDLLKLKTFFIENFTCIDEENKVIVFDNEIDLLMKFIKVKLDYYKKRKEYLLQKYKKEYEFLKDRAKFIKLILDGKIKIYKRKIEDVLKDCKENNIKFANKHLEMKITSFTSNKLQELKKSLDDIKLKIDDLIKKNEKELYLEDLRELKGKLNE